MKQLTFKRGRKQGKVPDDAKSLYNPFKLPEKFEPLKISEDGNKDEIEKREFLNFFHEICYQLWVQNQLKQKQENEESNFIHTSEYRRAS
jgi:hypothetical protein